MAELNNQIAVENIKKFMDFTKSLIFKKYKLSEETEDSVSLSMSSAYMVAKLQLYKETPEYRALGKISNSSYENTDSFVKTAEQIAYDEEQRLFCKEFEWNSILIYENINKLPIEERIGYDINTGNYLFNDEYSSGLYGERNSYYSKYFYDLFNKNINSKINFMDSSNYEEISYFDLANARLSDDYKIIYYKNESLSASELSRFLTYFEFNRNYFLSTNYDRSYEWSPQYHNFVQLFLVFCTIRESFSEDMKQAFLLELMDNYSLTNYLYSYGITFMDNANKSIKKKLIKNLSFLFNNKGSDKIFTTILSIFGFDNISIFKYYLINNKKDVHFLRVPYLERDINESIYNDEYTRVDFDTVISEDPTWDAVNCSKEVVSEKDFNIIQTKYYDIETAMNMAKEIGKLSCYYNLLHDIHLKPIPSIVTILSSSIENVSNAPIKLFDALLGLQLITLKFMSINKYMQTGSWENSEFYIAPPTSLEEYKQLLNFRKESDLSNSGFNLSEKIIDSFNLMDRTQLLSSSNTLKYYYEKYTLQNRSSINSNSKYFSEATSEEMFSKEFDDNLELKEKIESDIYYISHSYKDYKKLNEFYEYLFFSDRERNIFTKSSGSTYETYIEFLKERNFDFGEFIEKIVNNNYATGDAAVLAQAKLDTLEAFDILASAIQIFVTSKNIHPEYLIPGTVVNYVNDLINFFKSYTIELRRMNIYYSFDSKLDNLLKLMDSGKPNLSFSCNFSDHINGIITEQQVSNSNDLISANSSKVKVAKDGFNIYKNTELVYKE